MRNEQKSVKWFNRSTLTFFLFLILVIRTALSRITSRTNRDGGKSNTFRGCIYLDVYFHIPFLVFFSYFLSLFTDLDLFLVGSEVITMNYNVSKPSCSAAKVITMMVQAI